MVSAPTRSTQNPATLIDHVYISDQLSCSSCTIQPPVHGSDHNAILLSLNRPQFATKKPSHRQIWLYKQADFQTANSLLQCFSSHSLPANDVNSLWTQWLDYFMTTMSQTIPSKVIKQNHNLPYLTDDLVSAIRRKHKLYKDARCLNTDRTWSKYHKLRNRVTTALRKAKTNYYKALSLKLKSPNDFWTAYHKLIPKKSRIATDHKYHDVSASTSLEKANLLNEFFSSCFTPSSQLSFPDSPS